jgi:hypothetical protein
MNKPNIVLDFTINKSVESLTVNQELAIMPANLAKAALKSLAKDLSKTSQHEIVETHVAALRSCGSMNEVVNTSLEFIQERELIQNLAAENWDAYSVKQ